MNKFILLILIIALCACKKDSKKITTNIETINIKKSDSSSTKQINIISSEGFIENWAEIVSFESELRRVLNTDIRTEKDIELLIKLLEDLKNTYPERFKKPAIEARVKVLETEMFMLKQSLQDAVLTDLYEKKIRVQNAYNFFVNKLETFILKEKDYEKYR